METVAKTRILTANYLWLCFASLGAISGIALLMASLPLYVKSIGGQDSEVGIVIGAFALAGIVTRPFLGVVADQRGKKGLMLGGLIVMLVSIALYSVAQTIPLLLVLRALHGASFGAFITACFALVADVVPTQRRGEAMAYFGVFGNVAMAIGPAVGVAVANSAGFSLLFWIASATTAVALICTVGTKAPLVLRSGPQMHLMRRLFHRRALYPAAIVALLFLSYSSISSFLPLFVEKQRLGNPGLFFTVYAIVLIIGRGPMGRLSDKYGRLAVVTPNLVIGAAAMFLLATATSMNTILLAAVLYGICFAAVMPSLMAFTIDRAGLAESGSAMATYSNGIEIGAAGSIVWGVVAQLYGYETVYFLAAFTILLGIVVILMGNLRGRRSLFLPHDFSSQSCKTR